MESNLALPCPSNDYYREHISLVLENLNRWTGYDLVKEYGFSSNLLGEQVFNADFYLLSHNTAVDPVLNYGNQQVLREWEVSWKELTNMCSRETAKPIDRAARAIFMAQVKMHNYISGYSGVRISKTGKEFEISNGIVWNIFDSNGDFYGQAAWFQSVKQLTVDSIDTI